MISQTVRTTRFNPSLFHSKNFKHCKWRIDFISLTNLWIHNKLISVEFGRNLNFILTKYLTSNKLPTEFITESGKNYKWLTFNQIWGIEFTSFSSSFNLTLIQVFSLALSNLPSRTPSSSSFFFNLHRATTIRATEKSITNFRFRLILQSSNSIRYSTEE